MIKILDVSNSNKRPLPRGLSGPVENDIVRYLKKYANKFNCCFTLNEKEADIIFTNDVFPKNYKQPKLKRMDGVYNQTLLLERNNILNISASLADYVIFISEFSKNSLEVLYPDIKVKKSTVALNCMDNSEFFNLRLNKKFDAISVANNWKRPEKRGYVFEKIAQHFKHLNFALIGNQENSINNYNNLSYLGYIEDYSDLNKTLNLSKSFIYLGFNDPAPKTVCQSLNCHLPLFLTNSGGNYEIAKGNAYFIEDIVNKPIIVDEIPNLDLDYAIYHLEIFFNEFQDYTINYNSKEKFENMLEIYFNAFKSLI